MQHFSTSWQPVTVAERSKAWTVFARSEAGIVGSNPTQDMDVWCVCAFFCVYVVLCLGRGLATGWSLVQGVLPSVNDQETEKLALCSKSRSKLPNGSKEEGKKPNDRRICIINGTIIGRENRNSQRNSCYNVTLSTIGVIRTFLWLNYGIRGLSCVTPESKLWCSLRGASR
jgi:hypothetical protein